MNKQLIPEVIHCCWFGGKPLPKSAKTYMSSWKKHNPEYIINLWNENNFDLTLNQYVFEAAQHKKWAFVTDYVRLFVLYNYGGIYMDIDVEVCKSLDKFLQYPAFSGFEGYDRIPTGIIGACKENPWVRKMLQDYDNRRFLLEEGQFDLTTNVKTITSLTKELYPLLLNNTFQQFDDFVLFPFDWFCAKDIASGEIKKTENTHTIHHFTGSWMPFKKKLLKALIKAFGYKCIYSLVKIRRKLKGE